jgi:hypothetical protein
LRKASGHVREIRNLSNEKIKEWVLNISIHGLNLLVPPCQSLLYPFIIRVRLEHLYNVVIKHNVLKRPILQLPPFTPQRDTGLSKLLSNDNWNTIKLTKTQVYAIMHVLICVRLCTRDLLGQPLLPSPGCIAILGPVNIWQ